MTLWKFIDDNGESGCGVFLAIVIVCALAVAAVVEHVTPHVRCALHNVCQEDSP